jgi:putative peptidoglycan lipid II flippase
MAVTDKTTHSPRTGPSSLVAPSAVDRPEPRVQTGSPIDNCGEPRCETAHSADEAVGIRLPGRTDCRCPSDDVVLAPGAYVADGRYRLLIFHGGPDGLQFWQALDTAHDRQVALTVVAPQSGTPGEYVGEILTRTLRLSRLDTPGIARVLGVAHSGAGAVVTSEWVRGGSLREVAGTAPSPNGAARAMQSLAAAAAAAHRAGLALSLDHPDRIRVSVDGEVTLAFPATLPQATADGDVRGCGAVLYALLANQWPLPESEAGSGLAAAEFETEVRPTELSTIDPDIPFMISAAAAGALKEHCGIRTATTFLRILQQATAATDSADADSPPRRFTSARPTRFAATGGHRRLRIDLLNKRLHNRHVVGFAIVAAAIVAAMFLVASALSHIVGNGNTGVALDTQNRLGLNRLPSSPPPAASTVGDPIVAIKPLRATVFSPGGGADNPQSAGLAIDGDPATAWSTDIYFDAVPFPAFKEGVGLLLQLPEPTVLGVVTVDLDSTGTVVQIRSSPTATPAKLVDTTELTRPTPMQPGHNSIPVHARTPTSTVLVWISTLGTSGGKSRSDISEVTLHAAS